MKTGLIPSSKSTARPCLQRGIPAADRGQRLSVANEWSASRLMAATAFGPVGAKRAAEGDAADPVEGDAKPTKKQLRFRAVFHSSHRHCLKIESLADPAARRESYGKTTPQKHESPSEGPKNGIQGQKTASASSRIKDRRRRINSPDGRFRRESAEIRMQIRMHFRFSRAGGAPMPTGSRAKA